MTFSKTIFMEQLATEVKRFDTSVIRRPHLLAVLAQHYFHDYEILDAARKVSLKLAGKPPFKNEISVSSRAEVFLEKCNSQENLRDVYLELQASFATEVAGELDNQTQVSIENLDDVMTELDSLVGLQAVKDNIRKVTSMHQVNQKRKTMGLDPVEVSYHLVFVGDPGTGKTTVARIVARIYRSIGLLDSGQLIEAGRSDLVAGFVGQTALKVKEVVEKALGGVLFIDEAYSLSGNSGIGNDFGQEAVATLLKEMEDHRDKLAVIVAGYTDEMKKFINSNPGLQSRFSTTIEFKNYSVDELIAIFKNLCTKNNLDYQEEVIELLEQHFNSVNTGGATGNARYVRSIFEEMFANMSVRAVQGVYVQTKAMLRFQISDLPDFSNNQTKEKLIQRPGFLP